MPETKVVGVVRGGRGGAGGAVLAVLMSATMAMCGWAQQRGGSRGGRQAIPAPASLTAAEIPGVIAAGTKVELIRDRAAGRRISADNVRVRW